MFLYRITTRTKDGFVYVRVYRTEARSSHLPAQDSVAHGYGRHMRDALAQARNYLYNAALPEREGCDRAHLARYNARNGTSAPSLHD